MRGIYASCEDKLSNCHGLKPFASRRPQLFSRNTNRDSFIGRKRHPRTPRMRPFFNPDGTEVRPSTQRTALKRRLRINRTTRETATHPHLFESYRSMLHELPQDRCNNAPASDATSSHSPSFRRSRGLQFPARATIPTGRPRQDHAAWSLAFSA